jgi:hypothetical protein
MGTRRTRSSLALRIVSLQADAGWLERIHRALEKEIARGSRRLDASRGAMPEVYHSMVDEESEQTEELLGIAFVACQSYISRVWTEVQAFNKVCAEEFGSVLPALASFQQVLKIAKVKVARSRLTKAEAVFAAGNFWKHSDGWATRNQGILRKNKTRWTRLVWDAKKIRKRPEAKHTYDAVYALGMRHGFTGNLRHVAKRLGVRRFEDLRPIRQALSAWAEALLTTAKQELDKLSVL